MFFDPRLMKSRSIGSVWKSAHNFRESSHKAGPSINKICSKLEQWVQCEDQVACRRLSLRTSSTLISGTASLYKRKLEELLADLQYTVDSMTGAKFRRRQSWQVSDDQDSVIDSRSSGSKTRASEAIGDHPSSLARHTQCPEDQELNPEMVEEMEMCPKDDENGSPRALPENSDTDRSNTVNGHSQRSSTITRKNANTQTSPKDFNTEEVYPDSAKGEAEPQPFVCAIIYESNKTTMPTKILLSSVNPEVLKLFDD